MAKKPKVEQPKLTKKQKKALYKEQLALEKQLEEEGKIPRRRRYQPRGFFWRVFAVCLSFVFGIFAALGGAVGAVLYMGLRSSTEDVLGMLGFDTDAFLNETYSKMNVLDLYRTLISDFNDQPITSLSVLTKYTPLIDTYLTTVTDMLAPFGISPDWETIKTTEFSDLGNYAKTVLLPSVEIGPVLGLNGDNLTIESINSNAALYALAYGKYDADYSLSEGKISMKGNSKPTTVGDILPTLKEGDLSNPMGGVMDFIKQLELGSVLGLDIVLEGENENGSADILYTLCYGTEGVDYKIEGGLVKPLSQREPLTFSTLLDSPSDFVMGIEVGALLKITAGSDVIARYIAYGREMEKDDSGNYLTNEDGGYQTETVDGKLQYVGGGRYVIEDGKIVMLPDPNSETGEKYAKKTIGDLTKEDADILGDMRIGDMTGIDTSSSGLMQKIQYWTLDDLKDQSKIMSLKIGDVMTITSSSSAIIKMMANWSIGDLTNQRRIERLTIGKLLGEGDSSLIAAIADWSLSDLTNQDKFDTLTLGNILKITSSSPHIMQVLADMTLGEIATGIDGLYLDDVLGNEIFEPAEEDEKPSPILLALRGKKIKELGDAMQSLTMYDLFGDEMYTFATDYSADARPEGKVEAKDVETQYLVGDREVFPRWYTGSDEDGWTPVPEDADIIRGRYVEKETKVERKEAYYVLTYTEEDDKPYSGRTKYDAALHGELFEDDGYYFILDGERFDLEKVVSYLADGEEVTGKRIRSREGAGGTEYYYTEQVDVTQFYAAAGDSKLYTYSEVTEKYRVANPASEGGYDKLTRYFAGIWYLLFGENKDGGATPIAEMGSLVSGVTEKMNTLTLGEMYVHEVIDQPPYLDISAEEFPKEGGGYYRDLSEMDVSHVILFVMYLASGSNS